MRCRTAIGVDDDLAAGQACVAVRAADHELAGRVDVPLAILGDRQVAEGFADVRFHDRAYLLRIPARIEMLGGKYDRGDFCGLAILVAHRHLALGIRAELAGIALTLTARLGEKLQDAMRIVDRRRHEVRRLVAGIAEHDALVARAFFALLVGRVINALRDVGRL